MCSEFTNYMRTKYFIDAMDDYLPKLTDWMNNKFIFWQTDLGYNLLQPSTKPTNVKKCFTISSEHEQKPEMN